MRKKVLKMRIRNKKKIKNRRKRRRSKKDILYKRV
jgi:hypothetical protein